MSARLHALLMTVSFLGLAPAAILTARHGKKDARWFKVHANLQYAAAGICPNPDPNPKPEHLRVVNFRCRRLLLGAGVGLLSGVRPLSAQGALGYCALKRSDLSCARLFTCGSFIHPSLTECIARLSSAHRWH